MTRLTNQIRTQILRNALNDKFGKEKEALDKRPDVMIKKIYELKIPKEDRELLEKLDQSYLRVTDYFCINASGWRVSMSTVDHYPSKIQNADISEPDLVEELRKYQTDKDNYAERQRTAHTKTEQLLRQIKTSKQLEEVWPEGKEYYANIFQELKSTKKFKNSVPTINVEHVNLALGLPK